MGSHAVVNLGNDRARSRGNINDGILRRVPVCLRYPGRQVPVLPVFLGIVLAAGCLLATGPALATEPLTYLGFDANSYSPEANEGMAEIFSGRCFHAGAPLRVAMIAMAARSVAKPDLGYNPSSAEGRFYANGSVPSPPGRTAGMRPGLPLEASVFTRNGILLANTNCFACHAGVVHGQVVAGLGNPHIDQAAGHEGAKEILPRLESLVDSIKNDGERKEVRELIGNIRGSNTATQFARTRGDNFGPYAVWRLGAKLADPENQGLAVSEQETDLDRLMNAVELPTVDPMAWWLMKYKKTDYWYSDGGIDDAAHFSVNFTTAHAEANESRKEHIQSVAKALAFARETQSPLYPKSLNAAMAQMGANLFHGRIRPANADGFVACKTCHGNYTKLESQADWSKPGGWGVKYGYSEVLRDVKTDRAYNETLKKFKPIVDNINRLALFFDRRSQPELSPRATVPEKPGYVAPPLVGVWASAPYFHNGSVPTVEAVLNSKERPSIWARNNQDPHAYDLDRLGLVYKSLTDDEYRESASAASEADVRSKKAIDHRAIYDTRGFGRSNQGHTFGDQLSTEERQAVIEFLKSLSGPDMPAEKR
ncbi:MAG: hypothetical protein U1D30_06590 [Planctomycetota bacterium]